MKYLPGQMFGQFSGSSGSTTASHNRYGSYVRTRVIPTNPNSGRQQDVRAAFTEMSQRWRELSESQRTGWADLALQAPIIGPQGNQIILAGNAMFNRINLQRRAVLSARIDDAPALDLAPALTALALTATIAIGGTLELVYTASGGLAGNNFIIKATGTRSAGKTYVAKGELKQISAILGNAASPADIQAAYEAIFGSGWLLQSGMEIGVEVVGISANGFAGEPFSAFAEIS